MATFEPSPDLDPKVAQAIQDAMDSLREELLDRLGSSSAPAQLGDSGGQRLSRLERAVEALDSATAQTELLTVFLQEAGAFADRSLFLVRDGEELKGWAAFGFAGSDDDVDRISVECPSELALRQPEDDPAVNAEICDAMAAATPAESILVPFALRGKVAGALYADGVGEGSLDRPALRILSYVAAQAVETLPLRVVDDAAPMVATAEEVVDVAAEPAAVEIEPVETEVEPLEAGVEPSEEEVDSITAEVDEAAESIEEVVAPPPLPDVTDPEVEVDVERMIEEVEPEQRGDTEAADIVAIRHDVTPTGFETLEEADAGATDEEFDTGTFDTAVEEIEADEGEAEAVADSAVEEAPTDEVDAPPVEVAPPARVVEDSEVAPPEDLEGPGWAFTGSQSITDDSRHEEARRLARLLVTEIKLYNEEKVREGRESNDLYDQLRDDIERSRRIYEERIDDEVRQEADYFQEEVVRILAGGDSTALGS